MAKDKQDTKSEQKCFWSLTGSEEQGQRGRRAGVRVTAVEGQLVEGSLRPCRTAVLHH